MRQTAVLCAAYTVAHNIAIGTQNMRWYTIGVYIKCALQACMCPQLCSSSPLHVAQQSCVMAAHVTHVTSMRTSPTDSKVYANIQTRTHGCCDCSAVIRRPEHAMFPLNGYCTYDGKFIRNGTDSSPVTGQHKTATCWHQQFALPNHRCTCSHHNNTHHMKYQANRATIIKTMHHAAALNIPPM
jgi:hypothetical protein